MKPWLCVVGIGEDGLEGLSATARAAIDAAEVLVGGTRTLAMIPDDGRERLLWPSPFSALPSMLQSLAGRPVCVLASGDPLCYGVGTTIARHFTLDEMRIHPTTSSFSLVCARLAWNLPEVETVSLHARPCAAFRAEMRPGARIIALCDDATTPRVVAEMLCDAGYGGSRVVVLERVGGPAERVRETTARAYAFEDVQDLNTVAVECSAGPDAPVRSRAPGLPDDAFFHDGQLTKRIPRTSALAALAPCPGHLLWDVGAGCGSIGIEWMRAARGARAIAIERDDGRVALIERNAERLGVPDLRIVRGEAPGALADLDGPPDAAFIGGGLATAGLLDACWEALPAGGRLVAHAVTLEGERALADAHAKLGGELSRIAVSHAAPLGRYRAFRPALPVAELSVIRR